MLVLAPAMEAAVDGACGDLLTHGDTMGNVLLVSMLRPPAERLRALRRREGSLPPKVGVVSAGDGTRSAAADTTTTEIADSTVRVATTSEPSDLTGLGIRINQALSAWKDDAPIRLCFHSLTGLLQYADLQQAFQFLHVISNQIETVGGVAHYHMDPTAHDERTLATIRDPFDVVVEFEDGTWRRR